MLLRSCQFYYQCKNSPPKTFCHVSLSEERSPCLTSLYVTGTRPYILSKLPSGETPNLPFTPRRIDWRLLCSRFCPSGSWLATVGITDIRSLCLHRNVTGRGTWEGKVRCATVIIFKWLIEDQGISVSGVLWHQKQVWKVSQHEFMSFVKWCFTHSTQCYQQSLYRKGVSISVFCVCCVLLGSRISFASFAHSTFCRNHTG